MLTKIWQDTDNERLFLSYQKKITTNHQEQLRNLHSMLWQICESPIERKLLLSFLGNVSRIFYPFEFVYPDIRTSTWYRNLHLRLRFITYPDVELVITFQREISIRIGEHLGQTWRHDFVFTLYRMGGLQENLTDFRQINHGAPIHITYSNYDVVNHRNLWAASKFRTGADSDEGITLALRNSYIVGRGIEGEVNHEDTIERLAFTSDRISHIVVECDGHDTHERRKEDIRRDRRRDRVLQSIGFTILRYTGSEINDEANMAEMISEMYTTVDTIARRLSKIGPVPD